jgi:hypothetical protein
MTYAFDSNSQGLPLHMQEGHCQAGEENNDREKHEDCICLALPAVRIELVRVDDFPPTEFDSIMFLAPSIKQVDTVQLNECRVAFITTICSPHFVFNELSQY